MPTKPNANYTLVKRGSEIDNNLHLRLTSLVPVSPDILQTVLKMKFVQDVKKVVSNDYPYCYKIVLGSRANYTESQEQIIRTLNDFLQND
jgi:hypothetical protein